MYKKTQQKGLYLHLVEQYNDYVLLQNNDKYVGSEDFLQIKTELKECFEKFLRWSNYEKEFGALDKKREYEDIGKRCTKLLHNVNRELPIAIDDCKFVYMEYKTMMLMPWGSYMTIPQVFLGCGIGIIILWIFFRIGA